MGNLEPAWRRSVFTKGTGPLGPLPGGQAGLSTKLVHLVQAGDLSLGELSGLQSREGASKRV